VGYDVKKQMCRRRRLSKYDRDGRPGDLAFTVAVNAPVQGAGADAMKATMALVFERRHEFEALLRGFIHDEAILTADKEVAERVCEWLGEIMAEAERFAVGDPESPIAVDVAARDSWGEK
jgi:DNA polymerase I-like protein with 3'-5' exonuclease and polymerase domains